MVHRRRRVVFNNDGDDLFFMRLGDEPTAAASLLKQRTTALLGSQVDAIWYYSTWGLKLHHRSGPFAQLYGCPAPPPYDVNTVNYEKLISEGKDALEVMIDVCRKHGLEVFYSNRMNDSHDSFQTDLLGPLKRQHPEWCVSTEAEGRKHAYPEVRSLWAALNFEVPEVRRLTVEAIRELCRNYDIDGIELDFFRHFVYFRETLEHRPATPEHVAMITDLMRRIRRVTEEEGLRRGRPILVCGRTLEDTGLSKSVGLNVEAWLEEGIVDLLSVVYSTEHTPPLDGLIALAGRHGVPVYPMIDSSAKTAGKERGDDEALLGNLPVWRGDALNLFAQGAAGIQMFNFFDPERKQWWELGDPRKLVGLDHTYAWHFLPSQRRGRDTFADMRITRARWPVTVGRDGCEPMPLYVGEDLAAPPPTECRRVLTLRMHVRGLSTVHQFAALLNGKALGEPRYGASQLSAVIGDQPADLWLYYRVRPETFRKGENLITASVKENGPAPPVIGDIRLDVRFLPGKDRP